MIFLMNMNIELYTSQRGRQKPVVLCGERDSNRCDSEALAFIFIFNLFLCIYHENTRILKSYLVSHTTVLDNIVRGKAHISSLDIQFEVQNSTPFSN